MNQATLPFKVLKCLWKMDLNDTVQVDSLEVSVGEHIKEFVVRSDFYLNAIGFKTNKDKTYGLIGGNWGPLRNSGPIMKGLEHYYVDGIQGLTVVNQICEIQFKSVIYPQVYSILYAPQASHKWIQTLMIHTRMKDCKEIHWTTLMIIFWAMTIRTILMILTKTVLCM